MLFTDLLYSNSRYTAEQPKSNFIDNCKSSEGGTVKGPESGGSHWKSKNTWNLIPLFIFFLTIGTFSKSISIYYLC